MATSILGNGKAHENNRNFTAFGDFTMAVEPAIALTVRI